MIAHATSRQVDHGLPDAQEASAKGWHVESLPGRPITSGGDTSIGLDLYDGCVAARAVSAPCR